MPAPRMGDYMIDKIELIVKVLFGITAILLAEAERRKGLSIGEINPVRFVLILILLFGVF